MGEMTLCGPLCGAREAPKKGRNSFGPNSRRVHDRTICAFLIYLLAEIKKDLHARNHLLERQDHEIGLSTAGIAVSRTILIDHPSSSGSCAPLEDHWGTAMAYIFYVLHNKVIKMTTQERGKHIERNKRI